MDGVVSSLVVKDSWGWGQGQGSGGMVWAWGRVPGDRLWGGVQFCWQVGHLLFLASVVWASVAEVRWGLGLAVTSSDILKTIIELRPTILYLSSSIEGVIEYVLITVSALSTSPSLPNLLQIHFPLHLPSKKSRSSRDNNYYTSCAVL